MKSEALDQIAAGFQAAHRRRKRPDPHENRTLNCPVCGEPMETERLATVNTDVCRTHGLWLDLGEMEQVLEEMRAGQSKRMGRAITDARRDGKVSGIVLGLFSLLDDE